MHGTPTGRPAMRESPVGRTPRKFHWNKFNISKFDTSSSFVKPLKRSKSPGRRALPGHQWRAYRAPSDPLASGEGNIPNPLGRPFELCSELYKKMMLHKKWFSKVLWSDSFFGLTCIRLDEENRQHTTSLHCVLGTTVSGWENSFLMAYQHIRSYSGATANDARAVAVQLNS